MLTKKAECIRTSRHFFDSLAAVGITDIPFQPYLDSLILRYIGLDETDETLLFYSTIMDKRSKKIDDTNDSIMRQVLKAYMELMVEQHRRKKLKNKTPKG
jgi:hypothetical protein